MHSPWLKDAIGGVILAGIGTFVVIFSAQQYSFGRLANIGPGAFPVFLGCLLIVFGLLIAAEAAIRRGGLTIEAPDIRSLTTIVAALAAFGVTVDTFGAVPAIVLLTIIASFANSSLRPVERGLLAAGLCVMAVLIFRIGLGLNQIALWKVPLG